MVTGSTVTAKPVPFLEVAMHFQSHRWPWSVAVLVFLTSDSLLRSEAQVVHQAEMMDVGSCAMPSVRPPKDDRKYSSPEVDRVLGETVPRFKDPRLGTLWENCLPNTLDTTVRTTGAASISDDAFVVTGDIDAMWLRDSTNQLLPYARFLEHDAELRLLFQGIIKRQAKSVVLDVYANAFTLVCGKKSFWFISLFFLFLFNFYFS